MDVSDPLYEAYEAGFGETPWQGIFIFRGQSLDLSSFTITMSDDGEISSDGPTISTSTHMAPFWLAAAINHARDAERLSNRTNEAFRNGDADEKAHALTSELTASMQAITCSAFAVDSLFAALLKVQPTPEATKLAWRKNRTKRSRQIFETLRRAFKIGRQSSVRIKTFLDQLSDARDKAVHPPAKSKAAERHARLPVGVDPAFNLFRARNAIIAVGLTCDLIESAARAETAQSDLIRERMASLLEQVRPLTRRWKRMKVGRYFKNLQKNMIRTDNT